MTIEPKTPCSCGQSLPWHLFELELGLTHICLCGSKYVQTRNTPEVRLDGTAPNPFADAPTEDAPITSRE